MVLVDFDHRVRNWEKSCLDKVRAICYGLIGISFAMFGPSPPPKAISSATKVSGSQPEWLEGSFEY